MGAIEHCIEIATMGDRGSNNMGVDVRGLRGGGNGVSIIMLHVSIVSTCDTVLQGVSIIMLHCHSIWIQ